jgi:DNA-binding beta-propeller fold protein YncE
LSSPCPDRERRRPRAAAAVSAVVCGVTLALAFAFVAAGCSDRPRSNPLDPENPDTGGGPTAFVALAENGQVELRWNRAPSRADLLGFLLERRRVGPNAFTRIGGILSPEAMGTFDATVTNDLEYEYRLSYVDFDTTTIGAAVSRIARPGPEVGWVADAGSDEVVRLTPDARARFLTIGAVRTPNRLAVDDANGRVWVTEPFDGRAKTYEADGTPLTNFPSGLTPNALSVLPGANLAWICDEETGRVSRFTLGGTFQFEAGLFSLPVDVVATPDGGAWMVAEGAGRVYRFTASGGTSFFSAVGADPRRIALDKTDGSVWVSLYSTGEVVHLDSDGDVQLRITGLDHPYGIDVDESRDRVWVGLDGAGSVRALSSLDGSIVFDVPGIDRPRGLTVVDRTGECWVAAVGSSEIVRIGSGGVVASRLGGLGAPLDVKVTTAGSVPRRPAKTDRTIANQR